MNQAIFVGINSYEYYPQDELRGCVNDANNLLNWAGLPAIQGFPVLNANATAKIEKGIVWDIIVNSQPGDHIIWSHSSHGSNVPDSSQIDGLQEVLCCYDIAEKDGSWDLDTVITAKWIGEAITQLHPEATMDIIIDACHAPEGSQLKDMGLSYNRARFMRRSVVGTPVKAMQGFIPQASYIPENVALWSACTPAETSADAYIEGQWCGAFTHAFLKAYKPDRLRTDIIYYARKWLRENGYSQTPHLYCHQALAQAYLGG